MFENKGLDLEQSRRVDKIKTLAEELAGLLQEEIKPGAESGRMKVLALTYLEQAIMWTVKAISREPLRAQVPVVD